MFDDDDEDEGDPESLETDFVLPVDDDGYIDISDDDDDEPE
jgi:hypothetical protein